MTLHHTDTKEICGYPFQHGAQRVWLVDTPGFDDTVRADIDVLEDLATWLMTATSRKLKLIGIVHLHRITDVRLGGVAYKDLKMFQKLCGKSSFPSVVLGTTMWPASPSASDYDREKELKTKFYQEMIDNGAKMVRVLNTKNSALEVIRNFLDQPKPPKPVTLRLQKELGKPGTTLIDTAAGRELEAEKIKIRQTFEERLKENERRLAKAMEAKNDEMVKERIEQQEKLKKLLESAEKKEQEARARMMEEMTAKVQERDRQLEELRAELETLRGDDSDTRSQADTTRSRGRRPGAFIDCGGNIRVRTADGRVHPAPERYGPYYYPPSDYQDPPDYASSRRPPSRYSARSHRAFPPDYDAYETDEYDYAPRYGPRSYRAFSPEDEPDYGHAPASRYPPGKKSGKVAKTALVGGTSAALGYAAGVCTIM